MEITEFIKARVVEKRRAARRAAASPGALEWQHNWFHDPDYSAASHILYIGEDRSLCADTGSTPDDEDPLTAEELEHLGLNDPQHVQQLAAGLLQVVDEHPRCGCHDGCTACATCGDGSVWPCPTLLALANIWSGHPDFVKSWTVREAREVPGE